MFKLHKISILKLFLLFIVICLIFYLVQQNNPILGDLFKTQEQKKWESIVNKAVNQYVGQTLILPYTDSIYMDYEVYHNFLISPLKIITYVDADCSTCMFHINYWKDFISEEHIHGREIQIFIYASSFLEYNL